MRGVAVDAGDGVSAGLGLADGADVDAGLGRGVGVAIGAVVGLAVGADVALGVGAGVGLGVGFGVGFGVGAAVGAGVGGAVIVTEPPPSVSLNRSRPIASNVTVCVPAGSLPDQLKRTPCFQSLPAALMGCVPPATLTRTQSAGDPSRLR